MPITQPTPALLRLIPVDSLQEQEIDCLVSMVNEDQALRKRLYGELQPAHLTRAEFLKIGAEWAEKNHAITYGILTDKPVGVISISRIKPQGAGRIGYWIASPAWNQGIGTQAFKLVLGIARQLGLLSVSASIEADNLASVRIWEKQGATLEMNGDDRVQVRITLSD